MADENDFFALFADELGQKIPDDFHVLGRLRVAVDGWISIVIRIGDVADVEFAEVRSGKLWAVSFNALCFQCRNERLIGLGSVIGAVADDYHEGYFR